MYQKATGAFARSTEVTDGYFLRRLTKRTISRQQTDDSMFDVAKQFARTDMVVVAAPFWDMSIPAKLKIYFENVSVSDITSIFAGDK